MAVRRTAASLPRADALRGWTLLSLRPVGQHGALRAAAARHGARVLALSPLAIVRCQTAACRDALRAALAASVVIATSPNAVRAAAALMPLRARRGQAWFAIGAATARALARHGIQAMHPAREDSDGLLALPTLADLAQQAIGVLSAPGGRERIAPALAARGHRVVRADVYARQPRAPAAAALQRWRGLRGRQAVLLSSGDALRALLEALDAADRARLQQLPVVVASERLAALAEAAGFNVVAVAAGARPAPMLAALATVAARRGQRSPK